jgi:GntR family transcriptional regulator, rspAB operon transcriptional repressor
MRAASPARVATKCARHGRRVTSILADVRIPLSERAGGASARDQVYAALREAIVSAELEPGRRLSENELAELLGVSRTPVREALARLRDDRLVAIVPQLGTFVTLISDEAIADAAFVREALECSAIRLATERATPAQLEELQANLAAQERAEQEGDVDAFDTLDASLHRSLCELSGRDIAWWLSRRANGHLDRVRRLSLPEPGYLAEMVSEHRAVLAAVADGDAERAEETLRHHLRMVLSSMPQIRAAHPDYFEES